MVTVAPFSRASGDGFAQRQAEVVAAELQRRGPAGFGERHVDFVPGAVVAAGGDGELATALGNAQAQQAYMQIPAGVQCDGGVRGL